MSIPTRTIAKPQVTSSTPQADEAEYEQKMLAFVNEQIEKMRKYVQLGSGAEPTFYEVNQALCTFQDIQLALLALHNTAKIENIKAKENFDSWFAHKYIEVRDKVNPRSLTAQKWYSQKEIEMIVRTEYEAEYTSLNWALIQSEHQLNFLRRLLDSWGSYAFTLNQLSKNLIAEAGSLNFPDSTGEDYQH